MTRSWGLEALATGLKALGEGSTGRPAPHPRSVAAAARRAEREAHQKRERAAAHRQNLLDDYEKALREMRDAVRRDDFEAYREWSERQLEAERRYEAALRGEDD